MGVNKVIKYALMLAMAYAASGELGAATSTLAAKTFGALQHQQMSYAKFNRMLHRR